MWWFVGSFVPWIACDHKQIGYVSPLAKFTLLLQYLQSTLPLFWIANTCKEIMKKVNKGFKSNSLDIIFKLELKLQGNKKEE